MFSSNSAINWESTPDERERHFRPGSGSGLTVDQQNQWNIFNRLPLSTDRLKELYSKFVEEQIKDEEQEKNKEVEAEAEAEDEAVIET